VNKILVPIKLISAKIAIALKLIIMNHTILETIQLGKRNSVQENGGLL